MKIIVCGGLGFIGKHFIREAQKRGAEVINIDACTYAADLSNRDYIKVDINDLWNLPSHDLVINFAAETHVDNSISDSTKFVRSNVCGVHNLLKLEPVRYIQMSTDEVYGPCYYAEFFEDSALRPANPYSATKASADLIIQAHANTYGLNYNIIRPTNNYGPGQFPEKLIPRTIDRLQRGLRAQVHGDGTYKRMWLHVEDAVNAIWTVIEKGKAGEIYNVAGQEKANIDIIRTLCEKYGGALEFVKNRQGQDIRYAVNDLKLRDLGWKPEKEFSLDDWTPWGGTPREEVHPDVKAARSVA